MAASLGDLVVEVLHYWDDEQPPGWSVGSGFVVGSGLVLTAAHNVGDGELLVRARGTEWPARVLLRGLVESADLALVEFTGAGVEFLPCRYGQVDERAPGVVDRCWAVGFPYYKERAQAGRGAPPRRERLTTQVRGQILAGENLGRSLLTLQVDRMPAARGGSGQSEWSGMSGAVVFADDIVIGVVSEHHRPEGSASLTVVPVTTIDNLPDARQWWRALRTDPAEFVRLPIPADRDGGLYVWTSADFRAALEVTTDPGDAEPLEPGQPVDVTALIMGQLPIQQRDYALENQILTSGNIYNRGLPITTRTLYGRKREIATFRRDWESEQIRVLSVVAYGGTGKSALVNSWLQEMQAREYGGAQKVLAWSFYSQGTKENLVSADLFVSTALVWLGDESPPSLNLWARGLRLASLVKQTRFLLVLDGLEPLQYPPSAPEVAGQITDDSIRALLEELAKPDWEGLCLVTTRVPLSDLRRFQADGPGSGPGTVERLDLENLNERDGADLLQHLIGREADFRDLQAAVREVEGHALAITLMGNYLRDVHGGDLAARIYLDRLTVDVREGGHARRIMATYAAWLEREDRFAELTILRLIGLFDRPADPDAMVALLSDPQMRAFTGELNQGGDAWNAAVDALRQMGLLNREFPDLPGTLDAHPLVREHFRDQLRREHGEWWLQGNRTLFGYYQTQAPPLPDSSKDMNALYAAVTHGCAAGLYQQVFSDVLLKRVWRDRRTNFSTRRLGMTGSDLVALSNYFYPQQWTQLRTPSLAARARVLVLTNAGVRLRQLGRLVDARDCFGAVVREIDPREAQAEELEDASYAAAQYCELLVIAGKLTGGADESEGALFNGQRAVEYSNRGSDSYFSMHSRSSLAEVYFMLNDLAQADALFEQAMAIEREHRPRPPFLYSQGLFRYGYFLIETGRAEMILADESADPAWGKNGEDSSLLSEAIRLLILGAAHRALIEAGNRAPAFLAEGERILDDAINAFQTAGYADYTVRGLLERAHFYRALRNTRYYAGAQADLARAAAEARRGQMDLLYADVLLQQVACYLDVWPVMTTSERSSNRNKINDSLATARQLIEDISYGRRRGMLGELQDAAGKLA